MWLPLLAVACVLSLAQCRLSFYPRQYGESLNITCRFENDTATNLAFAVSLVISRNQNGSDEILASINSFKTIVNHVNGTKVSGSMNGTHYLQSNLTIQWPKVNSLLDGDYLCTLHGLDQDNQAVKLTQTLSVALHDMDPIIRTAPFHIQDGLTPSLMVDCSLTNMAVYGAHQVLSVDIYHTFNGTSQLLASFSPASQLTNPAHNTTQNITTPGTGWSLVSALLDSKRSVYLAIKLEQPSLSDTGTYSCAVSLNNTNNTAGPSTASTIVAGSAATTKDIYDTFKDKESLQDYYLFACNFEHGMCGLTVSTTSNQTGWTLLQDKVNGHGLHFESLQQDTYGHYLYLSSKSLFWENHFFIETPVIPPMRRSFCINFWLLVANNLRGMTISTNQAGVLQWVWSHPGFFGDSWSNIRLVLEPTNQPFSIVWEAFGSISSSNGFVAVDDIIISDINCP